MDKPVIEVRGVTIGTEEMILVKDINLTVKAGEILMIMGPSGCGKSTFMRALIGLQRPLAGEISIHGLPIWGEDTALARKALRQVGVMFQSGALFGSKTLLENVTLALEEHTSLPKDVMATIAMQKLTLVGLENFADYFPSEISGGMQKRAAIARAMVRDPKILFLDEPGAGLDSQTTKEIDELLLRLSNTLGMTIVVVSHELASVFRIASRIIMLDNKSQSVVADGDPHELKRSSKHAVVQQLLNQD